MPLLDKRLSVKGGLVQKEKDERKRKNSDGHPALPRGKIGVNGRVSDFFSGSLLGWMDVSILSRGIFLAWHLISLIERSVTAPLSPLLPPRGTVLCVVTTLLIDKNSVTLSIR
jgi:hypothetical protein